MTDGSTLERWKALGIRTWTLIGMLILFAAGMWLIGRILPVLVPFLMAAVLVFLLRAPVRRIETSGAPRWLAVLVCYIVAIAVLVVASVYILPLLAGQFEQFLIAFPNFAQQAARTVTGWTAAYWKTAPQWMRDALTSVENSVGAQLGDLAKIAATDLVSAGGSFVTFVVDAVLALFLAYYILVDLPTLRRELVLLFGPRWRPDVEVILGEVSTVVGGYLRGQAIIATVDGVLTAIGLAIVGMPYSGIIGLITGVLSIVPYVGPVIGGVIVVVTGLFVGPTTALLGLLVMIVVQQVDGNILGPRIMSREVDLHPALVIFSLLVGAELAGLIGMLVAIPVAGTGKALFAHYLGQAEASAGMVTLKGAGKQGDRGVTRASGPPEREAR